MKRTFACVTLVFLFLWLDSFGQQPPIDSIVKTFVRHRAETLQEKIFAHLHRQSLFTGEMLWFKLYVVDGAFHEPIDLSRVAYVELVDKDNRAVLQTKVQLNGGGGNGSVYIPATILTGNYTFRAYTQWMRNFKPDFYFNTTVSIINPFVKPDAAVLSAEAFPTYKVQLFPEGGDLVSGIKTRIGIKVRSADGPANGNLYVLGSQNDTLATAEVNRFGLGSFQLTAGEGSYRVVFKDASSRTSYHSFVPVQPKGYALSVKDSANSLYITVRSAETPQNISYTTLLVHARRQIIHAEAKPLYPRACTYVVPKSDLPDGISHITIFDENRQPRCERLYFTIPRKKLDIDVVTNQKQYTTRRKVTMDVNVNEAAQLSVSVYRMDSISLRTQSDIQAYLYLVSDLVGHVDSPEYYFNAENERVAEYTDNLMLTHGWRRFAWTDVFSQPAPLTFVPEVRGHLIQGQVVDVEGTPAQGVLALMSSPNKLVRLYGSRSNAKGEILFEAPDFAGTKKIIVQSRDNLYRVNIQNPFSPDFQSTTMPPLRLNANHSKAVLERSIAMQLQDIYLGDRSLQPAVVSTDSFPFFGRPDQSFKLDDYTRFPVLEEVMREYVPGVMVRKRKDGFHYLVIDKEGKHVLDGDPLVLLDGVPIFDLDKLMEFNVLKIERVDVVMRNYYLGPLVIPGIVSFSTYTGDLNGFELDAQSLSLDYEGLQLRREFYMPQYENLKQRNARMADQRNLLYWNPEVSIVGGQKQQLEFFTSDLTGDFVVVVQGLGRKGIAGSATTSFIVKKTDY